MTNKAAQGTVYLLTSAIRIFTGVLFIFSGAIKLNDPMGTQIKLEEYFEVFAQDFSPVFHWFIPLTLVMSVIFCVLEVALGVALLVKFKPKLSVPLLFGLIVFFTFLTFYSAYFNKVTDCGCFGDAIKLTPWTSFWKDVVLLAFSTWLMAFKDSFGTWSTERATNGVFGSATIVSLSIAIYAIWHLPLIDFRPYAVGENIPLNMQMPENAKPEIIEIKYTLKNSKSGQEKEMTDKEYMDSKIWEDTTWQITKTGEPVVIQKGDKPRITDYAVRSDDGDFTTQSFAGNKLFVIVRDVNKADKSCFEEINKLIKDLEANINPKVEVWALVSSSGQDFESFRHEVQLGIPYYYIDGTVSKTIMRSDPGLWLMKNGTVKAKWHYHDVPSAERVIELVK